MKYIIVLLIIVIAIIALLTVSKQSERSNDDVLELPKEEWQNYNKVLWGQNQPKDIVGCQLPVNVSNLDYYSEFNFGIGVKSNWLVANINIEDFKTLMENLKLSYKSDLYKIWSEAFECNTDFSDKWDVSNTIDDNTYFGEDHEIKSYIMCKYESGKLFVKRSTFYEIKIGDDEQLLVKVILKNEKQ